MTRIAPGGRKMTDVHIVGVDLAKRVFQVHGGDVNGRTLFNKKLSRAQFQKFIEDLPACIIAMEACGSSHHWGRWAISVGHEVRLLPAQYVKPFVKRHKNDAADAEAIGEAATRPSMRFVAVKTQEQQSEAMLFRTRELFVTQRTQLINATRAHLAEHGVILPQTRRSGRAFVERCHEVLGNLPTLVAELVCSYMHQIENIDGQISRLEDKVKKSALRNTNAKRLQTMPGVGPMSAMAIQAFCPPAETFSKGRDFAAWLGLVPRQHSSGGKERLGKITKMGQRDVRRLLIVGAMSVISASVRKKHCDDPWLARMLEKRPRMVVAVALANRMARRLWAMMITQRDYDIRGAAA